jgi:hypothetical protein
MLAYVGALFFSSLFFGVRWFMEFEESVGGRKESSGYEYTVV